MVEDYHAELQGPKPSFHWRPVKWIGVSVPRASFGKDLLYTFGAFLTICRVQRNNAEQRIGAMRANGWKPESITAVTKAHSPMTNEAAEDSDPEELAHDQIAPLIASRFKGHGLIRLVEAILKAQGYITYQNPEGGWGRRYSGRFGAAGFWFAAFVRGSEIGGWAYRPPERG